MQPVIIFCTALQQITWHHWASCTYDDNVAIFQFKLPINDLHIPDLDRLLTTDEFSRAQRYRRDEDRKRFMFTRAIVRILVGKYLNRNPAEVEFDVGMNRKPELKDGFGWNINVTHSGDWALLAVSRSSVGVDIENVKADFAFRDMLVHSFSLEEQEYIEAGEDSRQLFFQLWTRKEALVKATAKGIDDDFARVPSLDGTHQIESEVVGAIGNWTVNSFMVASNYQAAISHRFTIENLKFYTIDSGAFKNYES